MIFADKSLMFTSSFSILEPGLTLVAKSLGYRNIRMLLLGFLTEEYKINKADFDENGLPTPECNLDLLDDRWRIYIEKLGKICPGNFKSK